MGEFKYFFSYARKDSEFVLKLAQDLRAAGVNLWLDQLDILGGREWDREVEEALKTSRGMIAVLSPESVASKNVMNEVSYALEEGRLVVPVLLHPCDKPFRLRRLQHIDFTIGYDTGFSQLLRALGIEQPSQPPVPGPPERPFIREVKEPFGDRPIEPLITEPSSIRTEPPEPEFTEPPPPASESLCEERDRMDAILTAIIVALGKLSETVVKDGYEALKAVIRRKFGEDSDLSGAVEKLEKSPTSSGRKETLKEELMAAKADQDDEIIQAAKALLEMVKKLPGGQQIIQQTVTGDKNIFSGTGDVKVTFGQKEE
jgi:TIR domain